MNTVRWLPLATGLVPILAIHATYLISAAQGHVPWCFPYTDSCTSISATGRHGAAWYLFKATMIPAALLLALFWRDAAQRLASLGDQGKGPKIIRWLGYIAAIFLVVYTVALGADGDFFQLQRRIGIILYFSLTAFAELLMTWRLGKLTVVDRTRPFHLAICIAFLSIGILTLLLQIVMTDYDKVEDAFEWILALIMQLYFIVMYFCWQQPSFQLTGR
ncbi:MAG: hypothetical protein WD994_05420 [Pseudomonadales bacterium]